jgi:hypothetical protein
MDSHIHQIKYTLSLLLPLFPRLCVRNGPNFSAACLAQTTPSKRADPSLTRGSLQARL